MNKRPTKISPKKSYFQSNSVLFLTVFFSFDLSRFVDAEKAFVDACEAVEWSNVSFDKKSEIQKDFRKQKLEAETAHDSNNNKINNEKGKNNLFKSYT